MSLAAVYVPGTNRFYMPIEGLDETAKALVRIAMWASEPVPFDPMEVALHDAYLETCTTDERPAYKMVHEYPIGGKPPMMTHVFENSRMNRIIAAKGSPEALLAVCELSEKQKNEIETAVRALSADGYRVLGVGKCSYSGTCFPATQQEFKFSFEGLVAFYDPPKKNISTVLKAFYRAGIAVKIITGDHLLTTQSIAREIHFHGSDECMNGEELLALPEDKLREKVVTTNIFSRMFPEAKLKVINALKASKEIVAMTGDGVNDGPALKAAHIGIAMGRKGTEIAKEAASLVLLDDDLSKMVDAIAMGRRIYANLKKAIQYIISIHIPIILTVFIPLALAYPNIFSPVHIIFLELIMGPTCSIIYENEPMEQYTMLRPPRPYSSTFFHWKELMTSVVQGLVITAGALFIYNYSVYNSFGERLTRTMVFSCLISANIWLTLVNRSFYYSLFTTLRYKNKLILFIVFLTLSLTGLILFITPVSNFFEFEPILLKQLALSTGAGFISVIWMEVFKWVRRINGREVKK
jgi:Ca2+-transporting ATPase